jgi:hypothetical protein
MKNINVTKISISENNVSSTNNGVSLSKYKELTEKGCDLVGLTERKQLYFRKPLKNSKEIGKFSNVPLGKINFHKGRCVELAGLPVFDGDMFIVSAETIKGRLITYLEVIKRDEYRKDVCDILIREK